MGHPGALLGHRLEGGRLIGAGQLRVLYSPSRRMRRYVAKGSGPRSKTTSSWAAIRRTVSLSPTHVFLADAISPMCSS